MSKPVRFNGFVLDPSAYKLRSGKRTIRLERLPMELLLLLVERQGELVTREQIAARLWGEGVFVDVENGINTAIRKLRRALGDDSGQPRYIETVAARGYRFMPEISAPDARATHAVMLAVLPFLNLSRDASQEYFADGLTEETIAALGAIEPLGVIARTSSMAYKGTTKTVSQIGRELGVQYVLESSIRREADRVRVTAQLIRVKDQTHVWAQSYESSSTSLLDVQNQLARAIAAQVQIKLPSWPARLLAERGAANAEAHDAYLRGRFYWNLRTSTNIKRAMEYFREAIHADPRYSVAYAALAEAYATLPITSDAPTAECLPAAVDAAQAALRLDPDCSEAHSSLACAKFWMEWDWKNAEAAARKAIALNPSFALAHLYCAHILSNSGRHVEAAREIACALQLDPLSPHMHAIRGQLLFQAGRYADAEASVHKALVLNPRSWIAHVIAGKLELVAGHLDQALASLQTSFTHADGNTEPLSLQGYCYARCGKREEARRILEVLAELSTRRYVPPYNVAMVYAGLEDRDSAVAWLKRAHADHDVRMVFLPVDPKWAALNQSREVRDLLRWLPTATAAISQ